MYSTAQTISDPSLELYRAVVGEDFPKITALLEAGISITLPQPGGGKQVLHIACESKISKESIEELIRLGADVNARTERNFTPLHVAAQLGLNEIIIVLIKAGAIVDPVSDKGRGTTPLQEAANKGQPQAVKILIAAGADPSYRETSFGYTALDLVKIKIYNPEIRKATIHALLGAGECFKKQVSEEITGWTENYTPKNLAEREYMQRLRDISARERLQMIIF